jgi:iron(III) transport system ATP-binding protein
MSTSIDLQGLRKEFGAHVAIVDLTLRIEKGEFFTLLGPSGCGKTTLLRMIAGFNSIERGTVAFNGTVVNTLAPGARNIGMVFQNYALFPQMTNAKNVAFGLENRHVPKAEISGRVKRALDTVHMSHLGSRMPGSLSGGQQQRVALARALVISPDVLLMDEPLSNLDAKLRVEMRDTIREVQGDAGITTVYVTHDQEEAMAVSDRIAVMNEGVIQQVGTPADIYHHPANLFVAGFIGKTNTLERDIVRTGSRIAVRMSENASLDVTGLVDAGRVGDRIAISVRPEAIGVSGEGVPARIVRQTFLGSHTQFVAELGDGSTLEFVEFSQRAAARRPGDPIGLGFNPERVTLFDPADGTSVMLGSA